MINFVSGAVGHPDAVSAKGDAEAAGAGGLIVSDIKHEIVFDNVIVSGSQIDSDSRIGQGIVVVEAADLVFLDCVGASGATNCPNANGVIREKIGGGCNPTFHIDDVAPDHAGQWVGCSGTLGSDTHGINLVNGTCCRVADVVIFNEQAREDCGGRALNGYAAGGCRNIVVLDG